LKRNKKINFLKANNCLALFYLCLFVVVMNFSCKRTVYKAETRSIPKVMVLTTNINEVAPELSIEAKTLFKSLPTDWYCKHYGSGDGTKPWEIEDSVAISNKNGPMYIPLIFSRKTFCPYIITGIFVSIGMRTKIDNSWEKRTEIYFWSENDLDKRPTPKAKDTISIFFNKSDEGFKFSNNELTSLGLPINIGDSIYLRIQLVKNQENGARK
jgi:hypothetical protein